MDSTDTNAVAGPSNLRNSPTHPPLLSCSPPTSNTPHSQSDRLVPPPLFLPPPGPSQLQNYIKSTQDLLGQFHLHDAYDKYVRPFIVGSEDSAMQNDRHGVGVGSPQNAGQNGLPLGMSVDKGKGKEVVGTTPAGDGQDGDDDDGPGGKGEKKKKNSYKHLIKGVPGKHSLKKDDYLTNLMLAPPKQRVRISEFDSRTQRDAFTVSLEGLKGWNPSALVLESAQAREDRKKRKELKRLAKAQMQAQSQVSTPAAAGSTPIQAPVPTSATSSSLPNNTASTPRPSNNISNASSTPRPTGSGTPRPHPLNLAAGHPAHPTHPTAAPPPPPSLNRPGSAKPSLQPVQIPGPGIRVATPLRTATPTTATGPHPLSAPPLSASSITSISPPAPLSSFSSAQAQPHSTTTQTTVMRGKKREREREEFTPVVPASGLANGLNAVNQVAQANQVNHLSNAGTTATTASAPAPNITPTPKAIIGARAGNNGVRPRPIPPPMKKQRIDSQGVGRDTAPVQQHTPV